MALFGDLKDHAFTDLAKVLKPQTGTLFLHQAYQHRTVELNLSRGQILSLYLDGFPVFDQVQVGHIVQHLRLQGQGAFEFQPRPLSATNSGFHNLTLADLLQISPDQAVLPSQLPHPDTRFMFSGLPVAVPAAVAEIWALLRPHLESGASSAELSMQVGRSEDEVQRTLYQLRALNLVTPQRAGAPTGHRDADAPVMPSVPAVSPPLVHRFLTALRRLTGTART